jgi:Domain of unknown function (DUF5679)
MKCKGDSEMKNTKLVFNARGGIATKGVCAKCGTNMYKIMSDDQAKATGLPWPSGARPAKGSKKSKKSKKGGDDEDNHHLTGAAGPTEAGVSGGMVAGSFSGVEGVSQVSQVEGVSQVAQVEGFSQVTQVKRI